MKALQDSMQQSQPNNLVDPTLDWSDTVNPQDMNDIHEMAFGHGKCNKHLMCNVLSSLTLKPKIFVRFIGVQPLGKYIINHNHSFSPSLSIYTVSRGKQ